MVPGEKGCVGWVLEAKGIIYINVAGTLARVSKGRKCLLKLTGASGQLMQAEAAARRRVTGVTPFARTRRSGAAA